MHHDSNVPQDTDGSGSEAFSVEQGRSTPLTYTIQQDWCDLMPVSHGAVRMHRILRSMMIETKGSPPQPTRRLTMDRLAWIMSSFQKRDVGEQTIRDYRKELVGAQMLDVIPGRSKADPPRYVVHDLPPEGWSGWRNAWDVDDAYTPEWRTHRPQSTATDGKNGQFTPRITGGSVRKPGQITPRITGGSSSKSGHFPPRSAVPHGTPGGCHGSPWSAPVLTSSFGPPKEGSKEALSLAGHTGSPSAPRGESESAPAGTTKHPRMLEPTEAALRAVRSLTGTFGGKVKQDILQGLSGAIQGGLPPSRAVSCLNALIGPGVHSPGKVHRSNLETLPDPEPGDREQWLVELCTGCDERGVTRDEGFAVGSGSQTCLHGQERPETEVTMKMCLSCPRQIPVGASDRCGRCRRGA